MFQLKGADRKHKQDRDKIQKRPESDHNKYQPSYECTVLSDVSYSLFWDILIMTTLVPKLRYGCSLLKTLSWNGVKYQNNNRTMFYSDISTFSMQKINIITLVVFTFLTVKHTYIKTALLLHVLVWWYDDDFFMHLLKFEPSKI